MLSIEQRYAEARERYAAVGVDTEKALAALEQTALSIHCWQGDDVGGFESPEAGLSGGGIAVTGAHPGRARNARELRADMECALSLIPGRHRVNLHAIYGEFGPQGVERNRIEPRHFNGWIDWARELGLGLDFNCTLFSHPLAASGYTLSSEDEAVRKFWIEHVEACRVIAAHMGRELETPCVHNIWIADGAKDISLLRLRRRELLRDSLDIIFGTEYPADELRDSLESKLFGIGSETYVVGSHDFYLAYALKHDKMLCMDMGHYHPTESVADKISSLLLFFGELLLHVSRPLRWDSDHVVIVNDDLRSLAEEIIRARALERVRLALDFFDGGINRVGAWVTGARATQKALLAALLEPVEVLRRHERAGDGFAVLAFAEEQKTMPSGDVWNYFCERMQVPAGSAWIQSAQAYEKEILKRRG